MSVYWQVHDYDFINFDDSIYIYENPQLQDGVTRDSVWWALTADFTHKSSNTHYWQPITILSQLIDIELYGLNAGGHHMTNVILHILNVVFLFLILEHMTNNPWQSAFVAAIFGLHPLQVESVAWISERKDVLSSFFWLLTMGAYFRFVKHRSGQNYLILISVFVLGLMAKPMLMTLPFVLLLLDYWPIGRIGLTPTEKDGWKRAIQDKIPLFLFSAASIIITMRSDSLGIENISHFDHASVGITSYILYIKKIVWPGAMALRYAAPSFPPPISQVFTSGVLLAGVLLFLALQAKKRPYILVGGLWFLGTLVPVVYLVYIKTADRFTYVPIIGALIAIAWGIPDLFRSSKFASRCIVVAAIAIIVACTLSTSMQLKHWKDGYSIFKHTLEVNPDNVIAHNNFANMLFDRQQFDDALDHYSEALRLLPNNANGHHNMGTTLVKLGRVEEGNFHHAEYHFLNAIAQLRLGKSNPAVEHLKNAVRFNPDHTAAHFELGKLFGQLGKANKAIEQFDAAIKTNPDLPKAHYNLGIALMQNKKDTRAIRAFKEACRLTENKVPTYLATYSAALGEFNQLAESASVLDSAILSAESQNKHELAKQLKIRRQ
ncbi:MAG: tetratricopeptide repeat protein [Candidatus Lindowbacteria bacterium]|nr:tetratricopeptide repeat protein [Candidatus Lindowbacteria bacterium]